MDRLMMRPWSKLQRDLYRIIDKNINYQLHCVAYRMNGQDAYNKLPRYWITVEKETLWDYPKDFLKGNGTINYIDKEIHVYPYLSDVPDISSLLREYVDTAKELIFEKNFENDKWGLTTILKSADRRIGKRRLLELKGKTQNIAVNKIIEKRLMVNSKEKS